MTHQDIFIKTPITGILEEATIVTARCEMAMHEQPLCDYIMQSIFLKMTGFQEQKLKSIHWMLATEDYDYRYTFLDQKNRNASDYSDKNKVLVKLYASIRNYDSTYSGLSEEDRDSIVAKAKKDIEAFYQQSKLCAWLQHDYLAYEEMIAHVSGKCLMLFNAKTSMATHFFKTCENCENAAVRDICKLKKVGSFVDAHDAMHRYRNVCAHNISSYKQDLPTLNTLSQKAYTFDNYFIRFFLLICIDSMAIRLYEDYNKVSGRLFRL